jgi:predicted DNA-binding transcriptional regulator YafY
MRASRLLSILMLVQARGRVSAPTLARELEVSVRTIYRDVDALSAAGVPVFAEPGRDGGISLHEGWRTRLTGFTAAEAAALPMAGLSHVAQDLGVPAEAAAAQLKLLAALPAASGAAAQQIAARFHIDPVPWYHRAEALATLPALASAVWRERRIVVGYEGWRGAGTRRLDPLGLVQKGGLWYLVATARTQPRCYRVASIVSLEVLDEAAPPRPRHFELARWWRDWATDFERRLLAGRARVRISDEGQRILRAVMPAVAEHVAATQHSTARAGWVEAEWPFETPEYSARQLLRLGSEVEVLAPAELRAAVQREVGALAVTYELGRRGTALKPTARPPARPTAASASSAAGARTRAQSGR